MMIRVKNLFKKYSVGKDHLEILKDVNVEIEQGEFVAVLGVSGCGKSTLLNIIGGLDKSFEGNLYIDEASTNQFKEKDWNQWRKRGVGFVFQNFNLIPHLTAKENVKLAMKFNGYSKAEMEKRSLDLIAMVGLLEKSDYLPSQLSGGQKQRVAIARAMVNNPRIILADEPTGALDTCSANNVMEILHSINSNRGVTVIMVTHNKELAEDADKVIYMKDGQVERIVINDIPRNRKPIAGLNKIGKLSQGSAIGIGIRNVITQKKRSLLTILGTAVGIAGMVLMMGIGIGAENKINSELGGFLEDHTIWVEGKDEVRTFDTKDLEELESIEGIDWVLDHNRFQTVFYYQNTSVPGMLDALAPIEGRTDYEKRLVVYGTLPEGNDNKEIILTSDIAKKLLGRADNLQELIGKNITTLSRLDLKSVITHEVEETLTVVGIIESGFIAGASYIPYGTASYISDASSRMNKAPQEGAEVIAAESADYDKIVAEIRALGYEVTTNKEDFEDINTLVMALRLFLLFIAGVALFVSGIMIKIVLQTNVVERTKEIGVMCAIGAGRKDIKRIFIAEAAILGALAGTVGVVLGEGFGRVLNNVVANSIGIKFNLYDMSIKNVLICISISIVIAMLSGRKPAKKAAKLDPTIALRYE